MKRVYKDDYYAEINTIKNRDKALEVLEEEGLEDSEWAILDQISGLSNGLVPLEEEAMAKVESGDYTAAQNAVFGLEYKTSIDQINQLKMLPTPTATAKSPCWMPPC